MYSTAISDLIKVDQISKSFRVADQEVSVLRDISFSVKTGDFLIIFGPSGCGKSTLLHSLLGLEAPTAGKVSFMGKELYGDYEEDDRAELRKQHIGMVYQQPNWVKSLNVIDNVAFPLTLMGVDREARLEHAQKVLQALGMEKWAKYTPTELSSGQQQKVALARAIITNPDIIIADEPTGNLDYESGQELMELLSQLNQSKQKSIIMVTHDLEYLKFAKTAIQMLDGQIVNHFNETNRAQLLEAMKSKRGGLNV